MRRTAAVLGAGTVGLSRTALFAARGLDVRLQDPRSDLREQLDATAAGVDVVQEDGPERLEPEQQLWARVEAAAPAEALLLSSTSGLLPSDMAARMREPGRLLVGPPVQPAARRAPRRGRPRRGHHPGAGAGSGRALPLPSARCRSCCAGRSAGFVANRLQSALSRQSVFLVLQGVVTPEELDTVVTESVGVR